MKKMIFSFLLIGVFTVAFATPPVNEKVREQFQAVFPTVEDARWFENDGYYDVYFKKDEKKYQIRYDQKGKIVSSRTYYTSAGLCPFIKSKITEKFAGKSIFGITEISNNSNMYYVIVLQDEDSWTNVHADAVGQMTVLTNFKKAK